MSKDSIKVKKIGKYILQKEIGKGSIGKVWLSFHSGLGIPVAVKVLKPHLIEDDPEFLERFIQEGRLAVSLHHKNIIRIYDAGKSGEFYYLVMELLEGNDALHIINQNGAFTVDKVLEIGCAISDALIEAHEHGVIHRDIKPDNIMITTEGKIKLADLGLAKKIDDEFSSTMIGSAIGTPNYMSPEQAMDSSGADARSDIYSLGATLYHLITATVPFTGDSCMAVMMKHTNEELENPQKRKEGLPSDICKVIMKMMKKNPVDRYQTCDEVLTALNKIRYAVKEEEKPKTIVIKTKSFKRPITKIQDLNKQKHKNENTAKSNKILYIALFLASVIIAVLAGVLLSGSSEKTVSEQSEPKSAAVEKRIEAPVPETLQVNQPQKKFIDIFENFQIPKKWEDSVTLEDGVLEIKPRADFLYIPINEKIIKGRYLIDFKFLTPNTYGKIALFIDRNQAINVMIASPDHKTNTTGDIQFKEGSIPNITYKILARAKSNENKVQGELNNLEILYDGKSIDINLNGVHVATYLTDGAKGKMAVLATQNSHLLISRFEQTDY